MKASLRWLKELLPELRGSPASIAEALTSAGIEVEGFEERPSASEGVIVVEVRAVVPHPDASDLSIATLFDGTLEHTVVTGAPNVRKGQKLAFARVGAKLPTGVVIDRKEIRGVMSDGMLCSEADLGLVNESAEILVLKPRAKPGKDVDASTVSRDIVFEISPTPNRPDVLSHFGLARELAAIRGISVERPTVRVRGAKGDARARVDVRIDDKKRCSRYFARVVVDVSVGSSPSWLKQRLAALGVRSISNVVDATNLVLLELGHPLHAFDLDRLRGPKIVVRAAETGEAIQLLDGTSRSLVADDLVIADAERPIALAGVMGGAESEVRSETVNVVLESALFDARTVRRMAKRHGLHTEASHRFERGVDPEMLTVALDRCAMLLVELAQGRIVDGILGPERGPSMRRVASIRPERASLVLGRTVERNEIRRVLGSLGLESMKSEGARSTAMRFEVPSWRVDLAREEDLIEEVARISGYGTIPTAMPRMPGGVWTEAVSRSLESDVRQALVASGFLETISLAFNSRKHLEALGLDGTKSVQLENPLGEESRAARMSLLPALLEAARLNQDNLPSTTDLRLFEIGKVFEWGTPIGELPIEATRVGLLLRGHRTLPSWASSRDAVDAYDLKAAVETVLASLGSDSIEWKAIECAWLHPKSATAIHVGGRVCGTMGQAHPSLMEAFALEGPPVFLAEIDVELAREVRRGATVFAPLPKFPPAQRDLSFFVDRAISAERILGVIRSNAGAAGLESLEVFDVYEGKGVAGGEKSLAVSMVFRARDRTLTDDEVDAAQAAIIAGLEGAIGARVRSGDGAKAN